ncbi:unnamed protein product [Moneuplotes crassus]|uniref:Uncharacterized protein n=2 Tax=Euplotes crassus TaxID=5936 RepID=A0AAD1XU58_EUPCR|nr:unnamed protein product [Moneuplotes crassus]
MSDFTETVKKAYELYLLGQEKEAFSLLIKGTKHHYYLSIVDDLKKQKHTLSEETKKKIENFRNNFHDQDVDRLWMQKLFLEYDGAKDEKERQALIERIDRDYLYSNFHHSKPADVIRKKADEHEESKLETKEFDQSAHFNEDVYLDGVHNVPGQLYSLHPVFFNKVDFRKIPQEDFWGFLSTPTTFAPINNESFWNKLIETINQKYKTNIHFRVDQYLFDKFTLDQLEILGESVPQLKDDPHYIGKIFEKKFHFELDSENKDTFTYEERREQLIMMYKASENRPQSFKSALLLEILENGIKLNTFDKGFFIEYLKNPLKNWHISKKNQRRQELHDHVWSQYMSNLKNRAAGAMDYESDRKLYKKYLEHFFTEESNLDEFKEFFDKDFLVDLLEEFLYLSGKELEKEKTDLKKFENLSNQVLIDLLECNKDVFKKEERVKIIADIKNVQTLHVKIFEFNSENYYRKNLAPFRTDVDLDGLVTAHEDKYDFDEPPQKKFRKVFEFNQLDDRVGLFVIEFISNGYSSRAVIKKGTLSLIFKSTAVGQVGYILDENQEICKGERTGLWFQNQYFKTDCENGRVIIPYAKQEVSDKVILIHEEFAQLTEFRRRCESYSFNVSYIVNHESLLMGKEAKILMKPILKVNDRKCNLSILKNTKITLATTSFIDSLVSTKTFDNIQPNAQEELMINFQVPPNLQSIDISIETEAKNISKGTTEKLTSSHSVTLDTKGGSNTFYDAYLRKFKGSYYYYLLGKNGEPLVDSSVNLSFNHNLVPNSTSTILNTDKDGKIKLGPLKDITYVSTDFNGPNGSCSNSFNILNYSEKVVLPRTRNILVDERIDFPFICSRDFSEDTVTLVRKSREGRTIENCFNKISYSKKDGYQYGEISISGLERGHYELAFTATGDFIEITVHKGVYWENDSFILKDHSLVERRETENIIRISDIGIEEQKENGHKFSFKLNDFKENTRAHVFGFTFMPQDLLSDFYSISDIERDYSICDIFPFAKWKNIFLSNRKLGDEFRYVFDRKFLKRFMGNTLDRPQLLLNRHRLRETRFDEEVVYKSRENVGGYEIQQQRLAAPASSGYARNAAPQMQQMIGRGGGYGANAFCNIAPDMMTQNCAPMAESMNFNQMNYDSYCPPGNQSYKSFLNFLNTSPTLIENLRPNEDGVVECSIDVEKYSSILVFAFDENTIAQSIVDVQESLENVNKRDLSLSAPLDPEKAYNEMRNSNLLKKGESDIIEDITSTEYLLVDSLGKIMQVQDEIVKMNGRRTATGDFAFIKTWNTLSGEDKNKKYSRYMSNELNFFLYFKDREYFNKVVAPFIDNKLEKGFVDYWLLGDHQKVISYKDCDSFYKLNAFEKCLLISEVVKEDNEEAQALADYIKLIAERDEPDAEHLNRLFDSVINLNNNLDISEVPIPGSGFDFGGGASSAIHAPPAPPAPPSNALFGRQEMMRSQDLAFSNDESNSGGIMKSIQSAFGGIQKMARNSRAAPMKKKMKAASYDDYKSDEEEMIRRRAKMQFQEAEAAVEYCETHYYQSPEIHYNIINENLFWRDFSQHIVKEGSVENFLSSNFILAVGNNTENIAALSVLALPFQSPADGTKEHGGKGVEINAVENLILLKKEIKEAETDLSNDLLVIHRFFDPNNRNSGKITEFLVNKVYQIETIITNVSSEIKEFQILWQIPEGSLPLGRTNYQKSENKSLNSYSTTTFSYYFYFPSSGKFSQFPANITIDNKVVARANKCEFDVVEERTEVSNETFRDILHGGNDEEILEFLKTANLYKGEKGFSFYDILWKMKDKDFFIKTTDILRERKIYEREIWGYSAYHKDHKTFSELVSNSDLPYRVGTFFESGLIKCSPELSGFKHLDYFPMINSRAHKLGDLTNSAILNVELRNTYNRLLFTLAEKERLDNNDYLNLTYYYLLQDRINEAISIFEKVNPDDFDTPGTLKMQYDYMRAYLDFFTGEETGFKVAKMISKKYADYPILSWKVLFTEILDQLEEFEEGVDYDQEIDNTDETKKKANLKKSINLEPTLHCELEGKTVKVEYNNIPKILVKYYVIDPEVMFSRTPFLNQSTEDFAYVKPMDTQEVVLDKKLKTQTFEIIEKLQNQNLVIEISGEAKQAFLTYFSTSLKISINENFGELKVSDEDNKPLSQVYVKAFSKQNNGEVKFFKDGYTDIRGKFEYAQINSKKLGSVTKFAILAMSDNHGSTTREAKVPPNVATTDASDVKFLPASQMNKWKQQKNRAANRKTRKG